MVVPCFNKGVASPAFIIVHELAHLIEPSHNGMQDSRMIHPRKPMLRKTPQNPKGMPR